MINNHHYSIELLINYYQGLIAMNERFSVANKPNSATADANTANTGNNSGNNKYKNLINKLTIIRQLIIDKKAADISALHKPAPGLFIDKEHFNILEATILFYANNPDTDYDIAGAEQYANNNIAANTNNSPTNLKFISINDVLQLINYLNQRDSTTDAKLAVMSEQLNKIVGIEFIQVVNKSTTDVLASLNDNYQRMQSNTKRYDELLTEHITRSAANTSEAIEKEHARFVQKIASDSNHIINNVSEAVAGELNTQTNLVNDSLNKFEDKAFKRSAFIFAGCAFILFACSILSSTWTASKVVNNVPKLKIIEVLKPKPGKH